VYLSVKNKNVINFAKALKKNIHAYHV